MTLPISYDTIGIGASADDGTGDVPRTAWGKTNDNFDLLFVTPTIPYLSVTASKTLALTDIGMRQWINDADPVTVTIPPNSSVAFPVGTLIPLLRLGAGTATITGGSGVTLNGVSTGSTTIRNRYSAATIEKTATDAWVIYGDVEDVA